MAAVHRKDSNKTVKQNYFYAMANSNTELILLNEMDVG
jgi:hypothetical protein